MKENIAKKVSSLIPEEREFIERLGMVNTDKFYIEINSFNQMAKLAVENCGIKRIPENIGILNWVFYLTIEEKQIYNLPDSIGL